MWLKENLKATRFNDGTILQEEKENQAWTSNDKPAFCWLDNKYENKSRFGAIYKGYVVDSASNGGKNICPKGYRVPNNHDWAVLTETLGGGEIVPVDG